MVAVAIASAVLFIIFSVGTLSSEGCMPTVWVFPPFFESEAFIRSKKARPMAGRFTRSDRLCKVVDE